MLQLRYAVQGGRHSPVWFRSEGRAIERNVPWQRRSERRNRREGAAGLTPIYGNETGRLLGMRRATQRIDFRSERRSSIGSRTRAIGSTPDGNPGRSGPDRRLHRRGETGRLCPAARGGTGKSGPRPALCCDTAEGSVCLIRRGPLVAHEDVKCLVFVVGDQIRGH